MKHLLLCLALMIVPFASDALGHSCKPLPREQSAAGKPSDAKQSAPLLSVKPGEKKEEDCGCDAKAPLGVLAMVNGTKVLAKETDESIKNEIEQYQKQIAEARKHQLEIQVNDILLAAEAKKRGVSTSKLIDQEIVAKVKEPTLSEAQTFYEQNKSNIQGEFKDMKQVIIGYIRDQRVQEESKRFADQLRTGAQVKVLVEDVTPPENDAARARVFATVNSERV